MDTFSTSVSTFKVPSLPQTHRDLHPFKSHPYISHSPHRPQAQAQAHVSLIPKTKPFSHRNPSSPLFSSSSQIPSPQNPIFYTKPATGYAAAAIDIAQNSDSLHIVQRDIQRLLGFLKNPSFSFEESDITRLVLNGGFHRHVVALVKMLLKKKKIGIVREVLEEFERIYDELCGTQVVWVSSEKKMEKDQLFGIAENVQKLSGAVKIKVKNLVHESLPSFAV